MKQFSGRIIGNRKISLDFCELRFDWDPLAGTPFPGQFLTIRVSEDSVPLLRRPFAFSGFDADRGVASIIYQKRGRGTQILAGKTAGETLNVIGPLGKAFPEPDLKKQAILVAGGIGIGPILYLAQTLRAAGSAVRFIFGYRSASMIPQLDSFTAQEPGICTDDGSAGFHGTVADYLGSIGHDIDENSTVYCCGPPPMLRACHDFAAGKAITCWVSVEQIMACGVGACMGCAVRVKSGFVRACKEGPVFDSADMVW